LLRTPAKPGLSIAPPQRYALLRTPAKPGLSIAPPQRYALLRTPAKPGLSIATYGRGMHLRRVARPCFVAVRPAWSLFPAMIWFWLGFFVLVAVLLALDLGILHRKPEAPTLRSAAWWTVAWVILGLSFGGIVYLIYANGWLGAKLSDKTDAPGSEAVLKYVSAYLLEQALSIDNIFVIWLSFKKFDVPVKFQHRVLFWGIIGAIVFRLAMLAGGVYLATTFSWVFYIFGAYLAWQGLKMVREDKEEQEEEAESEQKSRAVRMLRRFVRIVDAEDHDGQFSVRIGGKLALTTLAVCLIVVELNDVVFALDSIPAVLSVSQETFIIVTSNIFAILGLRSLYFVLAGAMDKFQYLKVAVGALLVVIGVKMVAHAQIDDYLGKYVHVVSLSLIAGILSIGVIVSVIANRRADEAAAAARDSSVSEPGRASRSP
jgi:TerC family integral membrane protein